MLQNFRIWWQYYLFVPNLTNKKVLIMITNKKISGMCGKSVETAKQFLYIVKKTELNFKPFLSETLRLTKILPLD